MKWMLTLLFCLPVMGQMQNNTAYDLKCNEGNSRRDGRNVSHCEIKEQTIGATSVIDVDGGQNGGVSVKGWDRNDILVREQIQTWAPTESEAAGMVSQVSVRTAGGQIRADAPDFGSDHGWAVSYEIFVPHHMNVKLNTHNGGVHLADVSGDIQFTAVNGGAHLARLAGNVHGKTQNGGLHIQLAGNRWDGSQLDTETQNGGVHIDMPENYSARVETATVNGSIHLEFPATVNGKLSKQLAFNVGSGGSLIRAVTTNGGVHIKKI